MKIDLYQWYGPMVVGSHLYDAVTEWPSKPAEACITIERGKDEINIWINTEEEAEALIRELNTILEHLEAEAQEAA